MSNSYNTKLQNHNSSLEDIITQLNDMPDAGSGGIDTSDATATANDILSGKTAYVNDEKLLGTFTIESELSTQDNLITEITNALKGKAAGGENLDTCTVYIHCEIDTLLMLAGITTVENGIIKPKFYDWTSSSNDAADGLLLVPAGNNIVINNVKCNSTLFLQLFADKEVGNFSSLINCRDIISDRFNYGQAVFITASANEEAHLTFNYA